MTRVTRSIALVDGRRADAVAPDDRGLAYGDGLFETIRFVAGRAPLWPLHMRRLRRSCRRLRMAAADPRRLWSEASALAGGSDCVVKLILTRRGGRGYAPDPAASTRRILTRHRLPAMPGAIYEAGVRLRWCRLRLAQQPALAGLKHLNRLEQVLARAEWRDPAIYEGLTCDADGRVIGATAANVFAVRGGRLLTPRVDRCGVAGVARAFVLARARRRLPVLETDLSVDDVETADEIFLSNAVRGIVPVRALGRRRLAVGPVTARLGYTLAGLGIGLPPIISTTR